MATTFAGTLAVGLVGSYAKSSDLTTILESINYNGGLAAYTSGIGSNQANGFFSDTRTLAATNESHDLNAIVDSFGATLNFATLKLIYVKNKSSTTAQYLSLSGNFWDGDTGNLGPLGGTSPIAYIGPGGVYLWNSPIDGATVTNTTKDTITVTNAASFDYDIIIAGTLVP
jgi:hypothetical protein